MPAALHRRRALAMRAGPLLPMLSAVLAVLAVVGVLVLAARRSWHLPGGALRVAGAVIGALGAGSIALVFGE